MKKAIALLFFAIPCFASGPKFVGPNTDNDIKQEFDNVYQDIRNPVINSATISSATIKFVSISTMTASSATITSLSVGTLTTSGALGKVKQVQSCSSVTNFTTTSASFQTTNLTCSITPASASNSVAIFISGAVYMATGNVSMQMTIARGGSNIAGSTGASILFTTSGGATQTPIGLVFYDSPSSTSSLTYALQIQSNGAASAQFPGASNLTQSMLLVEFGS